MRTHVITHAVASSVALHSIYSVQRKHSTAALPRSRARLCCSCNACRKFSMKHGLLRWSLQRTLVFKTTEVQDDDEEPAVSAGGW